MSWVDEKIAAALLGYKSGRAFRRNVKERKIEINYRSTNGRKYQYSEKDLKKFQQQTAYA